MSNTSNVDISSINTLAEISRKLQEGGVTIPGDITANGTITGNNVTSTGTITGNNVTATGNITGNNVIVNNINLLNRINEVNTALQERINEVNTALQNQIDNCLKTGETVNIRHVRGYNPNSNNVAHTSPGQGTILWSDNWTGGITTSSLENHFKSIFRLTKDS
jgi:hypothetical protein